MAGVLILVEQYQPEALTFRGPDLRMSRRQARRQRHLRAEIECAPATQLRTEPLHQRQQGHSVLLRLDDRTQFLIRAAPLPRPGRQRLHQTFQLPMGGGQLLRLDQVLGELPGQRQYRLGDRDRGALGIEVAVPARHHAMGQLPELGFGEQGGRGFHRQQ